MCIPRHRLFDPSPASTARKRRSVFAFSLVEVVLALGIMTFAITGLIGVFAVGARADRNSTMEMEATHILQSTLAGRRARPLVKNDTDHDPSLILPPLDTAAAKDTSSPVSVDKLGKVVTGVRTAQFGLVYRITPTAKTNGAPPYSDVYCAIFWPGQGLPENADGRVEVATRIPLPAATPAP